MKTIAQLAPGEMATVVAEVRSAQARRLQAPQPRTVRSSFTDSSRAILRGQMVSRRLSGQRARAGPKVALFGKVEFDSYSGELTMLHPEFEILSGDDDDGEAALHVGRVVPIYEAVARSPRACCALSCIASWTR